ncbi:hypothetical protein [Niveibacterium sp.]|uniref:hypothetical protein n=1 Tax=Niveibacterium sp. TaxID=2017444 RepID=UPI0035B06A0F
MNELFAADPDALDDWKDLRHLLSHFGPFTGRYLACYPNDWLFRTRKRFNLDTEINIKRVSLLLQVAKESRSVLQNRTLEFNDSLAWFDNAIRYTKPPQNKFYRVIAQEKCAPSTIDIATLSLPPTADEQIEAKPSEYARACRTICMLSPRLWLVDPYLNPCKRDFAPVLQALISEAAKGKVTSISMLSRHDPDRPLPEADIRRALADLRTKANLPKHVSLSFRQLDDRRSMHRMHARYLFGEIGGVRLDQGFQKLNRNVEVGPIAERVLTTLLTTYKDGQHDMKPELEVTG